jgi:uncharacterized protein (TIGR00369 family)
MVTERRMRSKNSPIPFPARVPFVESLGIELHGLGDGQAELRIDLDAAHLNTWDVAHGGVVMTMLDVAMAMAARSAHPQETGVATIEMKTSFMRPAEHRLRAVAKLLHKTTTLAFCEASLFDDMGKLCANATGTFKYLRGLPARGRVTVQTAGESMSSPLNPVPPVSPQPEPTKDTTP